MLCTEAMTVGAARVPIGVVLAAHLIVPRCVSRNNVHPNNNLDLLSHDFRVEVSLIPQLADLVGDGSDTFVLVLEFGGTVGLIGLSFTVG